MTKYTKEEQIKIGQETFYRLLETEYGENIKDEIAKKYDIMPDQVSKYLNMFKRNVVDPKPSLEELLILNKYYTKRCQKINAKRGNNNLTMLLEAKTDEDYINIINTEKNMSSLKNDVIEYAQNHPEVQELLYAKLEKLMFIRSRELKKKYDEQKEKENNEKYDRYLDLLINVLRSYIDGNDYYPNIIFKQAKMKYSDFKTLMELAYEKNNVEIIDLYNEYCRQLKIREAEFQSLGREVSESIVSGKFKNILDFYRLTHLSTKKYKLFLYIANNRGTLTSSQVNITIKFFDKFAVGTYEFKTLEEAIQLMKYNYNGVELTPEIIVNLSAELFEQDIPINQNSIMYLFQEKINQKLNKR